MQEQHSEVITSRRQELEPIGGRKRFLRIMKGIIPPVPNHHREGGIQQGLPGALELTEGFETGANPRLEIRGDPFEPRRRDTPGKYYESLEARGAPGRPGETVDRVPTSHDQ